MRQNINQNIDLPQENVLQEKNPLSKISKFKLSHNPKIIFLLSLFLIIFIILIISLFISQKQKSSSPPAKPSSQPEKIINTPTPASQFIQKINQIELDINSGTLLEPPLIDDQIGL